jgi:hypothetical protein
MIQTTNNIRIPLERRITRSGRLSRHSIGLIR